jgi:hypothetical protein
LVSVNVKQCGRVVAPGPYPGRRSGEHVDIKLYLKRRMKKGSEGVCKQK